MENQILIRNFIEPWLGELHLKLIDILEHQLKTIKIYEVVDAEECEKERIGGYVIIEQENERTFGGESIDFINKDVLNVILNYKNK
jgi:hypothetical protein